MTFRQSILLIAAVIGIPLLIGFAIEATLNYFGA